MVGFLRGTVKARGHTGCLRCSTTCRFYREADWVPSDQDLLEVKRAAYEAVGFLQFLREFRSRTSRPIVVIGNDKGQLLGGGYGRFWVVEPMEERLTEDFKIRYDRVTSHGTMRLNVPSPFTK